MREEFRKRVNEMRAKFGLPPQEAFDAAHEKATREALLEHARMGRSVSTWRDGQVVWITPAEVFARYGLDENGRPKN